MLSARAISVAFRSDGHSVPAVTDVSFSVATGEVLAVVGESGSGKTTLAMSLLGLLPGNATVSGAAFLGGRDLFGIDREQLRAIRGDEVGLVFQQPMGALNPVFTVGAQLIEAITVHRSVARTTARLRAVELLTLVGLADPKRRLGAYPHELSGGQAQRVVIAMAVANEPSLLIADEPTSSLDVTAQAEILELLRDLRGRLGIGILLITHDMGVVADLADRVVVLRRGRVVEQAGAAELFAAPRHEHTRQLLGAVLSSATPTPGPANGPTERSAGGGGHRAVAMDPPERSVQDDPPAGVTLAIRHLTIQYPGRRGAGTTHAVDRVHLHVAAGEVLGLVGESGAGKTTIASAVAGLVKPIEGTIMVSGDDLNALRGRALREARARIGVVFQDPTSSLNPRATVADSIAEPLRLHATFRGAALGRRIDALLDAVELSTSLRDRFPHELSGGQRQRVGIARAIALDPHLLLADEPTSSLDVSAQARILDLIRRLQADLHFACLYISHDLAVIERLADRVAVMYRGRIIELGPTASVLASPIHPYTRQLITAAPVANPEEQRRRRERWRSSRRSLGGAIAGEPLSTKANG
jgi:peptide/nickel transport system ATP-binding protein